MFLDQPFTGAAQLQPGAVNQQMHRFGTAAGAGSRLRHVHRLGPPVESGVVGGGQGETEQADDGANQVLRLAQSEMEHGPQRQRRQKRQW
jgi:hypothetical protein